MNQLKLLCVGEKVYWVITGDGVIEEVKRVEGDISASYLVETSDGFNIVLTTFSKLLLIYKRGSLLWAAKTSFVPISVKTISM